MAEKALEGGCGCGSVRFRVEGEPRWVGYCHCSSCRRATGAPVTAYAGFKTEQVRWRRTRPKTHSSTPGVRRGFCAECGTPLSYEGERWPGEIHLHVGTFDHPERLEPTGHAFKDEHLPWLKLEGLS